MNDMLITTTDLDSWTFEAARDLPIPPTINGVALLRAIARRESSYGVNPLPRHENSWCPNQNLMVSRLTVARVRHRLWGCLACCSYGPLQVLYHTAADFGISGDPRAFLSQRYAFDKAVAVLVKKLLRQKPQTVAGIADMWNSGSIGDAIIPAGYIAAVSKGYDEELQRV